MSPPEPNPCTSEDYWNLPDGSRAELVEGELYDMAPPSWEHQRLVDGIVGTLRSRIETAGGPCKACSSPLAVNLFADDSTWVEPDVVVVCDPSKVGGRGVTGAPDFVAEVVSPSSRRMDYYTKLGLYERAGVREYWIVDPARRRTTAYRFDRDDVPTIYPFDAAVPVGLTESLEIRMDALL